MAKNLPLGTTETGKAWAIKALHPADATVETMGLPDMTALPTVVQSYTFSHSVITPTPTSTNPWSANIYVYAHPIIFGCVELTDGAGATTYNPILNPHAQGYPNYVQMVSAFGANVERYRMLYASATCYQDASALVNQGQIAVAQYPETPCDSVRLPAIPLGAPSLHYAGRLSEGWPQAPRAFADLQSLPNSYLAPMRDGAYAVFKLSEASQDWVNTKDTRYHLDKGSSLGLDPGSGASDGSITTIIPTTPTISLPYGMQGTTVINGGEALLPLTVFRRCDTNMIHISLNNVNSGAALVIYFRFGFEYQVAPATPLSCQAHTSPPYDPTALAAYYGISREMKDAYPADYNDAGKIVATIAKVAGPVLATIFPALSGPINMVTNWLAKFDKSNEEKTPERPGPRPELRSDAQLQRLIKEPSVPLTSRRPVKVKRVRKVLSRLNLAKAK